MIRGLESLANAVKSTSASLADFSLAKKRKDKRNMATLKVNSADCAIRIKLDEGAKMPQRAHDTDAGLDICSPVTLIVPAKGSAVVDTGVHIEIPRGYAGFLKSKSGLNVKHGITSEGVIDCGYTGSVCVKLYNNSSYDYKVNAGDKISQLVILPIITPDLEVVETEEELYGGETERGAGGFGSSGR